MADAPRWSVRAFMEGAADVAAAVLFGTMFGLAAAAAAGVLPEELAAFGLGGERPAPLQSAVVAMAALGALLGLGATLVVRRGAAVPERVVEEIVAGLERGDRVRALEACVTDGGALSRIAFEGLSRVEKGRATALEAVEQEARGQALRLGRMADALGTVARLAPLAGGLGCILGVIEAFDDVSLRCGCLAVDFYWGLARAAVPFALSLAVLVAMTAAETAFRTRAARLAAEARAVASVVVEYAAAGERPGAEGPGAALSRA